MPDNVARQHLLRAERPHTRPLVVEAPKLAGKRVVRYPSSDGKPMADSIEQERTMTYAGSALRAHFKHHGNILVAVNLFVYFREGHVDERVAPDVMVVRGVHSDIRGSYRIWEEGPPPGFVLEVLSKGTHRRDRDPKRELYAGMGVSEYFRYDPLGRATGTEGPDRLVGETLVDGEYRRVQRALDGSIRSKVLALDLRIRKRGSHALWRELRFRDPVTGEDLAPLEDERERRIQAEQQSKAEAERRIQAEQQSKAEAERREAEAAARREAERQRDAEAAARREAERRIAALEAELLDAQNRRQ